MLKKCLAGLSVVLLAAGTLLAADGTWRFPVPTLGGLNSGDLIYAVNANNLSNKALTNTEGSVFLPAFVYCRGDTTNLTPTRVAASDWALARTATGGETINVICSLNSWLQRAASGVGIKIDSIAISYQVRDADLTSHSWGKIATVAYATNVSNVVGTDLASTPILDTVSRANPYLTTVNMASAAYFPSATNLALNVEWQAVLQNNGVYRLYGVQVNFTRTDH
jgi:hypothetical protein